MPDPRQISVLLVDDHVVMREGLCSLLNLEGHFIIVGEARTGREAIQLAQTLAPDVILMDIAMPILNGLEATRQILAANPLAKIVVLSAYSDDAYLEHMCAAGVAGFLEKQTSSAILAKAIRAVAQGGKFFTPALAKRLRDNPNQPRDRNGLLRVNGTRLTSRETEVLQLVAEGLANKQIGAELSISIKTVEKHRQQLMEKLGIHDIAGLTRYAIAAGVIESSFQLTIV